MNAEETESCGFLRQGGTRDTVSCARSARKEAKRGKLLSAARAAFREKGYAATTIDDIIARVGGSRGTIYIYFGSKLALFETIVREEAERFSQTLARALSQTKGSEADIHDVAEQLFLHATNEETIGLLRMVIAERGQYPEIGEIYRGVVPTVQITVRRLFRKYLQRRGSCTGEPDFLAEQFLSAVADAQMAILAGLADEKDEGLLAQLHGRLSMILAAQYRSKPGGRIKSARISGPRNYDELRTGRRAADVEVRLDRAEPGEKPR